MLAQIEWKSTDSQEEQSERSGQLQPCSRPCNSLLACFIGRCPGEPVRPLPSDIIVDLSAYK